MTLSLREGMQKDRDEVIALLVENQYDRNDIDFSRGTFRVRGDVLEIFPVGHAVASAPCAWNFSATRSTASARFDAVSRQRCSEHAEARGDLSRRRITPWTAKR